MFEVGRRYEFRTIEAGVETISWGIVERYEFPLLKLQDVEAFTTLSGVDLDTLESMRRSIGSDSGRIINVTSPLFVSAVLQDR